MLFPVTDLSLQNIFDVVKLVYHSLDSWILICLPDFTGGLDPCQDSYQRFQELELGSSGNHTIPTALRFVLTNVLEGTLQLDGAGHIGFL